MDGDRASPQTGSTTTVGILLGEHSPLRVKDDIGPSLRAAKGTTWSQAKHQGPIGISFTFLWPESAEEVWFPPQKIILLINRRRVLTTPPCKTQACG
jgi:hypothetical protein